MSKRKRDDNDNDKISEIVNGLARVDKYAIPAAKQLYEMFQSGDANVQLWQTDSTLIYPLVAMLRREEDKCRIAAANVLGLLATNEDIHQLMVDAEACKPLVQMLLEDN